MTVSQRLKTTVKSTRLPPKVDPTMSPQSAALEAKLRGHGYTKAAATIKPMYARFRWMAFAVVPEGWSFCRYGRTARSNRRYEHLIRSDVRVNLEDFMP